MTKLRSSFLSLLLLLVPIGAAHPVAAKPAVKSAPQVATKPAPAPAARPALWKVADADTTIWLFGTIHALPPGMQWLDGAVAGALKGSDELVTEIPETDTAKMQAAVLGSAMLPAGETLRAKLTPADRVRFEQALAGFGLPAEVFDRFKPWYAAVALTALPLSKGGYTAANGVEERIAAEARKLARPRSGLETAEQQLRLFDSLPADVQVAYLHEVLEGLPRFEAQLGEMVREWQAGHADKLAELLNAEEDDPRMVETLLTNRNRTWATWVAKRMEKPGVVFMAVGAGHLAGKDSVQDILRQRGVTVTRVQ